MTVRFTEMGKIGGGGAGVLLLCFQGDSDPDVSF